MKLLLICPVFFCFVLVQDVFVDALPILVDSSWWSNVTFGSGGRTVDTGPSEDAALNQESPDLDSEVVKLSHVVLGSLDTVPLLHESIKTGQGLWKYLLQYINLFQAKQIGFVLDLFGLGQEALYRLIYTGVSIAGNMFEARNNIVHSSVETAKDVTKQMINGVESLTAIGNWFKNSITKIKNHLIEINSMLLHPQKDEVLIE